MKMLYNKYDEKEMRTLIGFELVQNGKYNGVSAGTNSTC